MHVRSFPALLACLLPLVAWSAPHDDLARAELFAFGGVGFAGITSEGEKDFHRVLTEPNPIGLFAWVAGHGKPAARIYALVGLYRLDRATYEALKASVKGLSVPTMSGCIGGLITGEEALRNIERGIHGRPLEPKPSSPATAPARVWLAGARSFDAPPRP